MRIKTRSFLLFFWIPIYIASFKWPLWFCLSEKTVLIQTMPVIKMMHTCTGPVKASCLIFFLQITNESGVDFNIPVQFQSNKVFSYRSTEEQNTRQIFLERKSSETTTFILNKLFTTQKLSKGSPFDSNFRTKLNNLLYKWKSYLQEMF